MRRGQVEEVRANKGWVVRQIREGLVGEVSGDWRKGGKVSEREGSERKLG